MTDLNTLVATLDLPAKIRLLTGADEWATHAEPAVGLRRMVLTDGPSGIRGESWDERDPALNLPSATALGSTWDTGLAHRYGAALAAEARRKNAHVVLGPTINLHRSPYGGRHFEAYSEDPLLTARLAASYVRGVQENGVAATPKHYVGNDFETERFTADVTVSGRALRELYLAAFEEAVVEARAWVVMSVYNSVGGTTMSENDLLAEPLCGEWGFDGVVVSDWWAVRTTEPSASARQDLCMPGPDGPWGDKLLAAVRDGRVVEADIDEKVLRLLRLASRVGALDGFDRLPVSPVDGPALAREVAVDGTVLVRNDGELPWRSAPASVAVIGHNAFVARTQGGGSAEVTPPYVVSPLDGLRAALPDAEITWHLGALVQEGIVPLPLADLTDPVSGEPGVRAVFTDAQGHQATSENRRTTDLARLGSVPLGDAASLRLHTRYLPTETGTIRFGVACGGHVRVLLDGAEILDATHDAEGESFAGGLVAPPQTSVPVELTAGVEVDVVVEYDIPPGRRPGEGVTVSFGRDLAGEEPGAEIARAVAAARAAEVAVVVVGTSARFEREAADRTTLDLPGHQDELVRAVAAANPRTVVVVNSGGPVTMPWRDEVAAVLLTWFGGQEYGNALADILLGRAEPGGRLPTTWPAREDEGPIASTTPVDGTLAYDEGVHIGHRGWLRAGAVPAYPFGHGLGYTSWRLAEAEIPARASADGLHIGLRLRNTGDRPGKQVVQIYLSRADSAIDRPARWLAGWAVVRAGAGEEREVTATVAPRAFAHWDEGWHTEPGTYTVHIGFSVDETLHSVPVRVG